MLLNVVMCRIKLKRIAITQEHSFESTFLRQKGSVVVVVASGGGGGIILTKGFNMTDWEKVFFFTNFENLGKKSDCNT